MRTPDPFGPEPPEVALAELAGWILHEDAELLVIDKPGWLVCHPSKHGPRSSLVGACREWTGLERLHLVSRLDRETSGLVLLAKTATMASRLQTAMQQRRVEKVYLAVLEGRLAAPVEVDAALGPDPDSAVRARVAVTDAPGSQAAFTRFEPVEPSEAKASARVEVGAEGDRPASIAEPPRIGLLDDSADPRAHAGLRGFTLARVLPRTGRKHQIRAHAAHIGHAVAGDKIYGPDETLFLEFIERGWTERMARRLPIQRQALHLARLRFHLGAGEASLRFEAPLPNEMRRLIADRAPRRPGAPSRDA